MAHAMPEHLGKREIVIPARFRKKNCDSSEGESEFEARRGTRHLARLKRGKGPVRMPTKGKPENKKTKPKTKNKKDDGWDTVESNNHSSSDEDEFDDVYEKIKTNRDHIHFVADNCAQLSATKWM